MEAIILAGGFGTRLSQVVKDVPKPMAPVAGHPFLKYVLDDLIEQGVDRIVLAVCYKKECILDYFGDQYANAEIVYSVEDKPLLTGGAIKKALTECQEQRVFVINGDTFFKVDLKAMRAYSQKEKKTITIAVKEMMECSRYGLLSINEHNEVTAFHEKQFCQRGFINGGIYDIRRDALDDAPEKFSLEQEFFPHMLRKLEIAAFVSNGAFIDIGVPEDYEKAQYLFKE